MTKTEIANHIIKRETVYISHGSYEVDVTLDVKLVDYELPDLYDAIDPNNWGGLFYCFRGMRNNNYIYSVKIFTD